MPITNHVTSLDLSRRLKELGVKQESYFWWRQDNILCNFLQKGNYHPDFVWYSAYLASELDQLIAVATNGEYAFITNEELTMGYRVYEPIMESEGLELTRVGYKLEIIEGAGIMDKNPADCRAKCLIYLIKNHLISVEELGK